MHTPHSQLHPVVAEFAASRGLASAHFQEIGAQYNRKADVLLYDWTGPGGQRAVAARARRLNPEGKQGRFFWNKESGKEAPDWPFAVPSVWKASGVVLVVEGETDTLTAAKYGIPALGVQGASTWKAEWWDYLRGAERVVCIVELDAGGTGLLSTLARTRPTGAPPLHAMTPSFRPFLCKDLNDLVKIVPDLRGSLLAAILTHAREVVSVGPDDREEFISLIARRLEGARKEGEDHKALCPFHDDTDGNFDFGPRGVKCWSPGCPSMVDGGVAGWRLPAGKTGYDFSYVIRLAAGLGIALINKEETAPARLISAREYLDIPMPPRQWLWEGILWRRSLGLIGAKAKHGKSTFCLHLLRKIAEGNEFLGKTTTEAKCVYLNFEMADDILQESLREVLSDMSPEALDRFLIEHPEAHMSQRQEKEAVEGFVGRIEALLEAHDQPGILIIDTARGAFRLQGDDEYRPGEVGKVMRGLGDLAHRTGWCIVVVHHFRKGSTGDFEDISGSGEWLASADVLLSWDATLPEVEDAPIIGDLRILGRLKPLPPMNVALSPGLCELHKGEKRVSLTGPESVVKVHIERMEEASSQDIMDASGKSKPTVSRAIAGLIDKGVILEVGSKMGTGSRPIKVYGIAPKLNYIRPEGE